MRKTGSECERCTKYRATIWILTLIVARQRNARVQAISERKKVEMSFAHLKRHMGFRRLRLRGLTGAANEFHLAAAAQNIKKLVRSLFPDGTMLRASPA